MLSLIAKKVKKKKSHRVWRDGSIDEVLAAHVQLMFKKKKARHGKSIP